MQLVSLPLENMRKAQASTGSSLGASEYHGKTDFGVGIFHHRLLPTTVYRVRYANFSKLGSGPQEILASRAAGRKYGERLRLPETKESTS